MSVTPGKAVFLSYASQDAEMALRISTALRAAGVEVWLDQEGGLVGGDAWDRKIREQIGACTLFVPLISANTQARHEGYFRLEWKLAEDRSHLIAKGKPFIVPVSIDATTERGALVPDAFLAVQWTKLPGGDAPATFVARVGKLLGSDGANAGLVADRAPGHRPGLQPPAASPPAPTPSSELAPQTAELSTAVRHAPEAAFETFERQRPLWLRALPVVSAVLVTALVVGGAVAWRLWPAAAPVMRFTLPLPEDQQFSPGSQGAVAISPDGTQMIYGANRQLFLRSMAQLEARPIPGTEAVQGFLCPVFSPDGLSVAFFSVADSTLKRISVTGGAAVTLCKADNPWGMNWGPDGIVFGQGPSGIMRVSPNGGAPETLVSVKTGEWASFPQMLPDGRTVMYSLGTGRRADKTRIVVQTVKSGEPKILIEGGTNARYLPTGHLIYAREGVIFAVPFDFKRLETTGGAVSVIEGVNRSFISVSTTGTLIYRPGPVSTSGGGVSIGFADRKGATELLKIPPGPYEQPRLSPDGKRIAFGSEDGTIWIYDLSGASAVRRLTLDGQGNNRFPVWSADSQRVTFQSDREKDLGIFWQRADGAGAAERLATAGEGMSFIPQDWAPDGTRLLYAAASNDSMVTLWMLSLADKRSERFDAVVSPAGTLPGAVFSPDGKWVAYASREGRALSAVYVQPFPPDGAKYQISKNEEGGHHPLWSPDGKELYYNPGPVRNFHVVSISTQPAFSFGETVMFARPVLGGAPTAERTFDISRDGQRLLGLIATTQSGGVETPQIQVVLNWFDELKRRVPVK